jgi:hypothetical protein
VTTSALPRPSPGKTLAVVVHANGYEDQTLLVDYFTSSPKAVVLKPLAAATDPKIELPADPKAEAAKPSDPSKPADVKPVDVKPPDVKPPDVKPAEPKPARPRPPPNPALPANPY